MESYNFTRVGDRMLVYKDNEKWKIILLLINPFFAFIISFFSLKERSSIRILYCFFVLFGFSLIVKLSNPDDCSRYLEEYLNFYHNPKDNFRSIWMDYTGDSDLRTIKDLYVYLVFYLSAILFPGNYHLVWGINSIVFAFFYLKTLTYITSLDNYKNTWPFIILTLIFMFSNSIYYINSMRFFTALWIAVYATFKIVIDKKWGYFLLLATTPLVHDTFSIYIVFVIISMIGRFMNMKPIVVLFVLSFIFSSIALNYIGNVAPYLPPYLQKQLWSYTESEGALEIISGERFGALPLYAKILTRLPHYFVVLLLVLLIVNTKKLSKNSQQLLKFLVLFFSLVNFISIIPSCLRFYRAATPFLIYLWVANYKNLSKFNNLLLLAPFAYSYFVFQWFRKMNLVFDPTLFLFPYPVQLVKTLFFG